MCGCTELIKENDIYICTACGCKYTLDDYLESGTKLIGSVRIDTTEEEENIIKAIRYNYGKHNYVEVLNLCTKALSKNPSISEVLLYKGLTILRGCLLTDCVETIYIKKGTECLDFALTLLIEEVKEFSNLKSPAKKFCRLMTIFYENCSAYASIFPQLIRYFQENKNQSGINNIYNWCRSFSVKILNTTKQYINNDILIVEELVLLSWVCRASIRYVVYSYIYKIGSDFKDLTVYSMQNELGMPVLSLLMTKFCYESYDILIRELENIKNDYLFLSEFLKMDNANDNMQIIASTVAIIEEQINQLHT